MIHSVYQSNFGPIDIRVVDPTSVQTGDFVIMMDSVQDFLGWKLYEKDANGVLELIEVSDVSISTIRASCNITRYFY